jgi:hypothetical protein
VKFEWDPQRGGAQPQEAWRFVRGGGGRFRDPLAGTIPDPEHSTEEPRFITIGVALAHRLLVVVHADRADRMRIISARHATRAEKKKYEEGQESGR